ncbi:hypothetical protein ACVIYH_009066 [Bradyrhizobium diazoefficiens]
MFILYFDGAYHEYYHATVYAGWTDYAYWRPGEGLWLVPGTDPEDDAYGREYPEQDNSEDVTEGDENDETLEYMCELLEAGEVEPSEFRRQLLSVGYHPDTISEAIRSAA